MSFESCSLSMTCDMEEVCSESSRKMQEMQDKEKTTFEASWTAVTKGKEQKVWRLEPERVKRRSLKPQFRGGRRLRESGR